MEKDIYLHDYLVSRLISTGKEVKGYKEIYYQTNEDLIIPYIDVDFYDKEVLSVLASSDHVLTARYLEAKKVDAFDNNRFTLYYFYLRIWSIKYMNSLYPEIEDRSFLKELLTKVKPSTEIERKVLLFYRRHYNNHTDFYYLFNRIEKQSEGRTLFTKASELEDCLSPNLNFYQYDLFTELNPDNIYDILLISNILDWARNDPNKLRIAAANLSKLLKKDGVVICHRLVNRKEEDIKMEEEIFKKDFFIEKKEKGHLYIKK